MDDDPTRPFNHALCAYITKHYPELVRMVFFSHINSRGLVVVDAAIADITQHNMSLSGNVRVRSKLNHTNKSVVPPEKLVGVLQKRGVTVPFDKAATTPRAVVEEFCEMVRFVCSEVVEQPPETKLDELKVFSLPLKPLTNPFHLQTCVDLLRLDTLTLPKPLHPSLTNSAPLTFVEWPDLFAVIFELVLIFLFAVLTHPATPLLHFTCLTVLCHIASAVVSLLLLDNNHVRDHRVEWVCCALLCGLPALASLHLCRKGFTRDKFV